MRQEWRQSYIKLSNVRSNYNLRLDPRDIFLNMNSSEKKEFLREARNQQKKSKGLGDTIEKFTKATGIKKIVDKASKLLDKDCGCDKRKDYLNKVVPYGK
jgi:hypothetical protein